MSQANISSPATAACVGKQVPGLCSEAEPRAGAGGTRGGADRSRNLSTAFKLRMTAPCMALPMVVVQEGNIAGHGERRPSWSRRRCTVGPTTKTTAMGPGGERGTQRGASVLAWIERAWGGEAHQTGAGRRDIQGFPVMKMVALSGLRFLTIHKARHDDWAIRKSSGPVLCIKRVRRC